MKALKINNSSEVKVKKSYTTPHQYGIEIEGTNGVSVYFVEFNGIFTTDFNKESSYKLRALNIYTDEHQRMVDEVRPFISVEVVEVDKLDNLHIPFPGLEYKEPKGFDERIAEARTQPQASFEDLYDSPC